MGKAIEAKIRINSERLNKKLNDLCSKTSITQQTAIKEAGKMFLQSVIKQTPQSIKNRNIKLEGVEKRWSDKKGEIVGGYMNYLVFFRTANKRGVKYFKKMSDAKEFAKIKYRGLGKAGWLNPARKLGADIAGLISNSLAAAKGAELGRLSEKSKLMKYSIELSNRVSGIGNYGGYAVSKSLGNTKIRVYHWLKRELKKQNKTG